MLCLALNNLAYFPESQKVILKVLADIGIACPNRYTNTEGYNYYNLANPYSFEINDILAYLASLGYKYFIHLIDAGKVSSIDKEL